MRFSYIITYDICDPKRLRRVYRVMRNWGDHIQYSVFECQLKTTELIHLKMELAEILCHTEDQVLFVNLGPSEGRGDRVVEAMGVPYISIDRSCYVV